MTDETYNGWKNYPTWNVNLWLNNDEPIYRAALDLAREEYDYAPNDNRVVDGIWTLDEARRFNIADRLKDWVTNDLAPDLGASFAADLLGYALGEVDWNEIAVAWIESVTDQVTA